jgi:hypothetical protein
VRDAEVRAQRDAEYRAGVEYRAAERKRKKELKDAEKVFQLPKEAKSKASAKPQSKITKRGGAAARRRPQVVHKPSSAPQGVKARSGHVTRPTNRLR